MMRNTNGLDVTTYTYIVELTCVDPGQSENDVRNKLERILEKLEMDGMFSVAPGPKGYDK